MSGQKARRLLSLTVLVALVAIIVLSWSRLGGDFWPPDRSFVGPNLVASVITWAAILIGATLLYPPTRRLVERFFEHKFREVHEKIEEHAAKQREHNLWAAHAIAEIHATTAGVPLAPHPHFDLNPKVATGGLVDHDP